MRLADQPGENVGQMCAARNSMFHSRSRNAENFWNDCVRCLEQVLCLPTRTFDIHSGLSSVFDDRLDLQCSTAHRPSVLETSR